MHAQNFLASLNELTPREAENWVAAALAEEAAQRDHDDRADPPADDAAAMTTAQQLRAAWRRWVDDAESLLDRLRGVPNGYAVTRSNELERAVGRVSAMLKLTPQRLNERRRQADEGRTLTGEE